uniref:t-SNARE coiled-coil homology domain-containing protein n=1 Tax=Macrostomum lignano TaxID=282301 RepID=A0A1I8HGM2_9PLAT
MSYGSIGGSSGSAGFSQQEDDRKAAQLIDRCTYNVQKLDNNVKDLERLCAQLNAGRPSNVVSITSAISEKQSGTNALISASADLLQQLSSLRTDNSMLNTRRTRLLEQYKASATILRQNVASAADNAEEGRDQLRQAVVYKRKARKKCIILIIVGIVVAGILALIIYLLS